MPRLNGVIIDGVYYPKGKKPLPNKRAITDQRYEQDMQRSNHKRDLIQPWKYGKLNEEFTQQYPDEAKQYGFKPKE